MRPRNRTSAAAALAPGDRLDTPLEVAERRRGNLARLFLAGFAVIVTVAVLAQAASLLLLLYTPLAVVVAATVYRLRPHLYVGFTLWIWFVSPLVRRLVDYNLGFNETNPVLLAPILVSGLTIWDLLRYAPRMRRRKLFPFVLLLLALGYGYLVGLTRVGVLSATYSLITWTAPLCFGCGLALHYRRYRLYRESIQEAFAWGLLFLGIYAVLQFVYLAEWDRYWMIESGMTTIGIPEPYQVRVFGSLNSPGPLSAVLVAGLLIVAVYRHPLRWPSLMVGILALLLSLVRAAWMGWIIALFLQWAYAQHRGRLRLAIGMAATVAMLLPLLAFDPFASRILPRMSTFTTLETDRSFQARQGFYQVFSEAVLQNPVGYGLGSTGMAVVLRDRKGVMAFESGWLDILYSLGWPGGLLFLGGLFWLFRYGLPWDRAVHDPCAVSCRATAVAFLWIGLFGNAFTGVSGLLLWGSLAMSIASREWHAGEAA